MMVIGTEMLKTTASGLILVSYSLPTAVASGIAQALVAQTRQHQTAAPSQEPHELKHEPKDQLIDNLPALLTLGAVVAVDTARESFYFIRNLGGDR
jgi:hypothetical protein